MAIPAGVTPPASSHLPNQVCRACKITKQRSDFSKNARHKDGLQSECKACTKAYLSTYQEKNRDRDRAYKAACYAANKEEILERNKLWRKNNRERYLQVQLDYYKANRERILANSNARYEEKGEEIRARLIAYRRANPERMREIDAKVRAKRLSAPGSHTASDIAQLLDLQRGMCAACRCDIKKNYHVDHIEPLARGGSNDRHNLQLLCPTCNRRKHARNPIEFMNKMGFLL